MKSFIDEFGVVFSSDMRTLISVPCNTRSFIISGSVTKINTWAFTNCRNLTSVGVSGRKFIFEDGILFNRNKTTLIASIHFNEVQYTIPNSVTKIGENAFYGCKKINSINILKSVTKIGLNAFHERKVTISKNSPLKKIPQEQRGEILAIIIN